LGTRAKKVRAFIVGAIVLGVGTWITNLTTDLFHSTTERIFAGPALSVRVVPAGEFFPNHPYAPYYVVDDQEVPGPTALTDASAKGLLNEDPKGVAGVGVAGSPEIVRLELRAKSDEPVILEAIRVNVIKTASRVSGWFVAKPACGVQPVRVVDVDLDASPPAIGYVDPSGRPSRTLALRIGRTEPEVLELQASTVKSTVDWTAELLFSGPDGADSVQIDDGGDPFRVTTPIGSKGYRPRPSGSGGVSFQREPAWDHGIQAC